MINLEIAVFNIASAIKAQHAGADRIELCENPFDGGTTPSYGTLTTIRQYVSIPIFVIIRPKGGDFYFDDVAFEVMQQDVKLCKELGFEGVVIGLLHKNGSVDVDRTKRLVEMAYPLEVTFHRAFDRAKEPLQAMEDIIAAGCQRILTSGQVPNAPYGKSLIKELVQQADDRIIIMPGSGVRSNNIISLIDFTGVTEVHSSARKMDKTEMLFTPASMLETLENISVDEEEIKLMKQAIAAM